MMILLGKDGKQLLFTSIVFLILDVIAVVLRLIAKSRTKSRFSIDDLWIILTLIVFAAWAALVIGSKETEMRRMRYARTIADRNRRD